MWKQVTSQIYRFLGEIAVRFFYRLLIRGRQFTIGRNSCYQPVSVMNLNITHSTSFNSFMTERSVSYRNQSINLLCKSKDWFLYDRDLRHERKVTLFLFCLTIGNMTQCTTLHDFP